MEGLNIDISAITCVFPDYYSTYHGSALAGDGVTPRSDQASVLASPKPNTSGKNSLEFFLYGSIWPTINYQRFKDIIDGSTDIKIDSQNDLDQRGGVEKADPFDDGKTDGGHYGTKRYDIHLNSTPGGWLAYPRRHRCQPIFLFTVGVYRYAFLSTTIAQPKLIILSKARSAESSAVMKTLLNDGNSSSFTFVNA